MDKFKRKLLEETEDDKSKFEKITEKKLDIKEGIKKNKEYISDIFFFLVSSLLILGFLGLLEVINTSFNWEAYLSIEFWIDYITLQVASWSARIIIRNLADRKEFRNNQEYIQLQKDMQLFVEKDSKAPFIERYSEVDDKVRKITAFKNKQKRKIIKLSNKHRITNIVTYVNQLEKAQGEPLEPFELKSDITYTKKWKVRRWANKQVKINNKLNAILITLTDEWIEQNIETIKVKYNKVSRTILVSGYYAADNQYLGEDYRDNSTTEFMKMTIPITILAMTFMFVIIPLSDSSLIADWEAWFKLIAKTFIVFFSGLTMWLNNPTLFKKTKHKALSERVNRINIYHKEEQKK